MGEPLALIGSSGRLEISIRNGNAAEELQADCGRRKQLPDIPREHFVKQSPPFDQPFRPRVWPMAHSIS